MAGRRSTEDARGRGATPDPEPSGNGLRRELARGTLELATLAALASSRTYAYALLRALNDLTGGTPEIKEGTLYPLLHRLEDAGYISSDWEARDRTRPRKYYMLTPRGKQQLKNLRSEWQRVVDGMNRLLKETR